jgi:hypothetical protein
MQVLHQLPSHESSRRRQKRQIHEVTTLRSIPLGAASARLRTRPLSCSSCLLISTHPGLSSKTGPSDWSSPAFCPASPASRSKHRENRDACEDATPQLCPSPTPDSIVVVYHGRYHKVVNARIPVSHISRSRLTVIDSSSTKLYKTTTTTIPQRLTVAVISSRDSHPVFSPSRLARFRTTCSHLLESSVARAGKGGVPRVHACT